MHTTRSYFFPSPRKYPSYLPQTILLLSWNGSSFVNDSNGDSFMASSLPFLLVSCTPRVASADERWNHGVVRISLARVKESHNREREREWVPGVAEDNTIPADSVYGWSFDPGSLSLSLFTPHLRVPYIPPLFLYRYVHTYKCNV